MKVAVSAESDALSSPIDPRFGRAPWLVVVDTETRDACAHENREAAGAAHGAGVRAARAVVDLGARAVVTGNVGPNAFEALRAAGIDVYLTYAGTVERVVERLESGGLRPALRPSRRGHAKAGGAGSQAGY